MMMIRTVQKMFLFLCVCCAAERKNNCGVKLCFTWTVAYNRLTLTCKVGLLDFWVQIVDPLGKIQAKCLPPATQTPCDSFNNNGSISQNIKTNATVYVWKGNIDHQVNGKWKCIHGTNVETGFVDVTVLKIRGNTTQSCNDNCTVMIAIIAVFSVLIIISCIICVRILRNNR